MYFAPEVLRRKLHPSTVAGKTYSCSSDMWSVGVMAVRMLWRRFPFGSAGTVGAQRDRVKRSVVAFHRTCAELDPSSAAGKRIMGEFICGAAEAGGMQVKVSAEAKDFCLQLLALLLCPLRHAPHFVPRLAYAWA